MDEVLARVRSALADRYVVERELGAGGMATVYLARDLRHDRLVALKILRPELSAVLGGDRFLAEIRVTARLQHPHLLPLFDSGSAVGLLYYVMPFVEGESLRDRLDREKQLGIDDAVRIATQVASALDHAHRHGVIHRDIKPENILLHDGNALVADFGIALALRSAGGGRLTGTGLSLGTPQYMSPEQALGDRELDTRTDIYSLGCVLYEMLAGSPPHSGPTAHAVLAKVLTAEPQPITELRRTVPEHVARALDCALAKLPADRFATAAEFADVLTGLRPARRTPTVAATRPARASRRRLARALGLALIVIAAVGAAAAVGLRRSAPALPPMHVTVALPPGVILPMDTEHPVFALSPDGARLVFVGEADGTRRLYMRALREPDAYAIPGTEGGASPFFSPDGDWIGFFAGNLLGKVAVHGGAPVALVEVFGIGVNRGAAWIATDTIVLAGSANSGLAALPVAGERRRVLGEGWVALTDATAPHAWPASVRGGRHVLFADQTVGRETRVALLTIGSRTSRTLAIGGTSPRHSATGHVLFVRDGALQALPFDTRRGTASGPEIRLLDGIATESWGTAHYAVADNGTLAFVSGRAVSSEQELVWVDRAGAVVEVLLDGGKFHEPRVSPDGARVAFSSPDGANYDIWILDLARRLVTTRLTSHPGEDLQPVWSPDGRSIAFASEIGEDEGELGPGLAWIRGAGEQPERLLRTPELGHLEFPASWSPDGQWLAFVGSRPGAGRNLYLLPTTAPHEPRPLLETPANEYAPMFSPDGRWIAYVSDISGRNEVYVMPFPNRGEAVRISTAGGVEPNWSRDGRELFYREGDRLLAVRASASWTDPGPPELLFEGRFERTQWGALAANYDVAPDGRRFLMIRRKHPVAPNVIHLILNWPEALDVASTRRGR
jgi:eukaryotic-like serine/threonine-protein kinase